MEILYLTIIWSTRIVYIKNLKVHWSRGTLSIQMEICFIGRGNNSSLVSRKKSSKWNHKNQPKSPKYCMEKTKLIEWLQKVWVALKIIGQKKHSLDK